MNLFNLTPSATIKELERAIYEFYKDVPANGVSWATRDGQDTAEVKFYTLLKFKHAISKGDPTIEGRRANIRSSISSYRKQDNKRQRATRNQPDRNYNQDEGLGQRDRRAEKDYERGYADKQYENYDSKYAGQKYGHYQNEPTKYGYDKNYRTESPVEHEKDVATTGYSKTGRESASYSRGEITRGSRQNHDYKKTYDDSYKNDQDQYYYEGYNQDDRNQHEDYYHQYNKKDHYKGLGKKTDRDYNYGKGESPSNSQLKDRSKKSPEESYYKGEGKVPVKEYNEKYDYAGGSKWNKADDYNYYQNSGYNEQYQYKESGKTYGADSKRRDRTQKDYYDEQYDQYGHDYYGYYQEGHEGHFHPKKNEHKKQHQNKTHARYDQHGQYEHYDYSKNLDYYDYNNPKNPKAEDIKLAPQKQSKKAKEYDCTGGSFAVREVTNANERHKETSNSVHQVPIVAESGYQKGAPTPHSDAHAKQIAASSLEQYDYRQKFDKSGFKNESYAYGGASGPETKTAIAKRVSLLDQLQPDIPKLPVKPQLPEEISPQPQYSYYGATANDIAKLYSQENSSQKPKPASQPKTADLRKISEEISDENWGRKKFYNTSQVNNKKLFKE